MSHASNSTKKSIVLVHGGFVDGSGWERACTEDRMIPPPAQRFMSQRAGSKAVEVAGSHAIYVSQPEAVAKLIEDAAQQVGTTIN